jgi:hypothetical protein
MAAIYWRTNYDYTQPQVGNTHMRIDHLLLQVAICMPNMCKEVGKTTSNRQIHTLLAMHPLKKVIGEKYLQGQLISTMKNGAKSSNSKINNFFTLAQFYGS